VNKEQGEFQEPHFEKVKAGSSSIIVLVTFDKIYGSVTIA
jgi:hypothetical protein